ncbi:MAG: uracil-DNA glycosylase [Planctomycetes bacterium]|nr:uracil-DNA glycosylase [Planctomycetota bacterium]
MDAEIDLFNAIYLRIKFEQSLGLESLPRDRELVREIKKSIKNIRNEKTASSAKEYKSASLEDVEKALQNVESKHVAKSMKKKPLIEFADIKLDDSTSEKDFVNMELSANEKHEAIENLHDEILRCQRCEMLVTNRNKIVPGDGNINTPLVFIGEAPGADEDREGIPFIGRAGKKLTEIIEKGMGIPRKEVFIGNVLKCRPPKNRDPQPEEIENCQGYLRKQIEIIKPKVIFALGAYAARFLTEKKPSFPLGKLRGEFHKYKDTDILIAATYHPSYLIQYYSKENRQKVLDDTNMVLNYLKEQGIYPWW